MEGRTGMTRAELAKRYGVTTKTVDRWRERTDWPGTIGKRGRSDEWDPRATDAVVATIDGYKTARAVDRAADVDRRAEDSAAGAPRAADRVTTAEIAAAWKLEPSTARKYADAGQFGEPVSVSGDTKLYDRAAVDRAMGQRRGRGRPRKDAS